MLMFSCSCLMGQTLDSPEWISNGWVLPGPDGIPVQSCPMTLLYTCWCMIQDRSHPLGTQGPSLPLFPLHDTGFHALEGGSAEVEAMVGHPRGLEIAT